VEDPDRNIYDLANSRNTLVEVKNCCQFLFKNIIVVQHDSRAFECKKEE
jgi:hypothetical protein